LKLINSCLVLSHKLIDVALRVKFKVQRYKLKLSQRSSGQSLSIESDSQAIGYEVQVSNLISDGDLMRRFRRNFQYRLILEHVSYRQGLDYQKRISSLGVVSNDLITQLALDDTFGDPRRYYYKDIGWISPTLLRYVSVYSEIESFIGLKNVNSIVEIGIGYGGQARVINKLGGVIDYKFYDLKDVQTLASTYLARTCPQFLPGCLDIENIELATFDLVISNYAISELPIDVQQEYLEKVINTSTHCYLIMNSGASNKTGRSSGKLPQDALLRALPGSSIHPEIPLTGPDNWVLIR
jgi:putative sugar O-methyltransferase